MEIGWSSEDIVHVAGVAVTDGFTGHVGQTTFVAPPVRPVRPYSRVSTIGEISGHPVGRLLRAVVLVDIRNGRPGAAMGRTGRSTGRALRGLVARATG